MTEATIFVTDPPAQPDYFLAVIPILPGCVASGKTREEAIANARRAFREYRALLEAHGVAIDHWKDIDPDRLPVGTLDNPPLVPGEDTASIVNASISRKSLSIAQLRVLRNTSVPPRAPILILRSARSA